MTRKRENICVGDYEKRNTKKRKTIASKKKIDDSCKFLPEELVIDNVLTRLPFRSLARFSSVSKCWYNLIFNDKRFKAQHLDNQKNNRKIMFSLLNVSELGDWRIWETCCIFELQQRKNDCKDVFVDYELLTRSSFPSPNELVGYCNGLVCVRAMSNHQYAEVTVINPARSEYLKLLYLNPIKTGGKYLCHGFGFDSLSKQYKVVVIYTTTTIEGEEEFVCMVYTLGGTEWRKIVTRTSEISSPPQPDSSSFQPPRRRFVTRAWREYCRSATLCGGDLYWRVTIFLPGGGRGSTMINDNNTEEEVLLSFDIHREKFQFIRLPTECSTTTMRTPNQPDSVVDHHLLEFKRYPCVAVSEKTMKSKRDRQSYHHRRPFRSCHIAVHMYILKDKVQQVWTREEVFNATFKDTMLSPLPSPFSRCCFENITTTTPPTRILNFSDQVVLYWFDGECLVYHSSQVNGLKVAEGSLSSGNKKIREIFKTKMKGISPGRGIGMDGNSHCPYMDYQLHAQVENILSLKTFIPQGRITRIYEDPGDFGQCLSSTKPAGWLTTTRNAVKYEVFYNSEY